MEIVFRRRFGEGVKDLRGLCHVTAGTEVKLGEDGWIVEMEM